MSLRDHCKKCGLPFDEQNTGHRLGLPRSDGLPRNITRFCRNCHRIAVKRANTSRVRGPRILRSHCKKCGTEFTEDNTYRCAGRSRRCKNCLRLRDATRARLGGYRPSQPAIPAFTWMLDYIHTDVYDHTNCDPATLDKCPDGSCLKLWSTVSAENAVQVEMTA